MLECLLIAGTLFFHVSHAEEAGVRLSAGSTWEFIMPVNETTISALTELKTDNEKPEHMIQFFRFSQSFMVYLHKDQFPDFDLVKFLESCPKPGAP